MANRFELVETRLKYGCNDIFLIKGIYSENKKGENELICCVDGKKLPMAQEVKEGVEVRQKYGWYTFPIDTEYYFWVTLPEDVKGKKKLSIMELAEGKVKTIFSVPIKKIFDKKKALIYGIDQLSLVNKKLVVSGWSIWEEGLEVGVYDTAGNRIKSEIQFGYRRDVIDAFPEVDPEVIRGFKIKCDIPEGKKISICFKCAGKQVVVERKFIETKLEKAGTKVSELYKKGMTYYKRHGLKETLVRTKDKLTQKKEMDYEKWLKHHMPSEAILSKQKKRIFEYSPKISIVVPLYKTPEDYLKEMIESVRNQTYSNWELCLSDGSGKNSPIEALLKKYQEKDKRIKVAYTGQQMQISENTNEGLKIATGDFIAFADHDDLLAPNALYECVRALNKHPKIRAIYTDEDKVSMDGKRHFQPHFKPHFNRDLLNSTNYFCHLFVVDKKIVDKVGGLDSAFDGAQDYDFVLRCSEVTQNIYHIPKILYHWRAHMDSTAENPESKMYAFEAGARAIQAHYDRIGMKNVSVTQTECLGVYRTHYDITEEPLVSIIIPNKDHIDDLDKCLKSIERTSYHNYEVIVVENNSVEDKTFQYYEALKGNEKVQVVYWKDKFNYSAINNFGVESAKGEYFLFLNNDTEIINKECIHELLGFCMRDDVGAVGARLYFDDNTIQHAGVVVGLGGIAGHIFLNTPYDQVGYFARIITQQDYSAVTAACVMVKKAVFESINGFDTQLEVAFNDVDLCLRIREAGYLVVYNPYAELYHYESKSRGSDNTPDKIERFNRETAFFEKRWEKILRVGDPYYNRNFAIDKFDCSIRNV